MRKFISIRNFFRTASLAGVMPGMTSLQTRSILGPPEDFLYNPINAERNIDNSPIWIYRGVEVCFDLSEDGNQGKITEIHFNPDYLWRNKRKIKRDTINIHRWIFTTREGPSIQELVKCIDAMDLEYQDTGLQILYFDRAIQKNVIIDYQSEIYFPRKQVDPDTEVVGCIVLRNGVQIRNNEIGTILRVAINPDWMIKGKEADISWEMEGEG